METPITCLLILDKVGRIHQPRTSNHRLQRESRMIDCLKIFFFLESNKNLFFFKAYFKPKEEGGRGMGGDQLGDNHVIQEGGKQTATSSKQFFSQTAAGGEEQFIRKLFWWQKAESYSKMAYCSIGGYTENNGVVRQILIRWLLICKVCQQEDLFYLIFFFVWVYTPLKMTLPSLQFYFRANFNFIFIPFDINLLLPLERTPE